MIFLSKRSKTVKELADRMGIDVVYNGWEVPYDENIVIRWGNTSSIQTRGQIINSSEAIASIANKKRCRETLTKWGFPVPELSETKFPVVGRPTKHTEGRKFFICHNSEEVERAKRLGATYFSRVYPKTQEYRVHVAGGRCILMSVKEGKKEGRICWNHHKTGFVLRHMHRSEWLESERLMRIVRLCKEIVEMYDLDFAAVDVMADPTDSSFPPEVICEINSTPALSDLALEKYVYYFESIERHR